MGKSRRVGNGGRALDIDVGAAIGYFLAFLAWRFCAWICRRGIPVVPAAT